MLCDPVALMYLHLHVLELYATKIPSQTAKQVGYIVQKILAIYMQNKNIIQLEPPCYFEREFDH